MPSISKPEETAPPSTVPAPPSVAPSPTPTPPLNRKLEAATWQQLPGWQEDDLSLTWSAFLQSCRGMSNRTQGKAWKNVCERAKDAPASHARHFFEDNLRPWRLSQADKPEKADTGLITGYYEPLLKGNRQRSKNAEHPVLGVPGDLLTVDLGSLYPDLKDKRVRGRIEGNKVLPYWSRAEIQAKGNQIPAKHLAYVEDPIELFFLQVQGSGRVQLPDGSLLRLNYADQNGHPYQSIGRTLVDRGELKLEEASMQGIQAWARANPKRVNDLLNTNPSYVFFREVPNTTDGPLGALGVPLTPERSIAIDPRHIPLGSPVFISSTYPNSNRPLNRLVMAQDTGGAIKGIVRADFFWGFGKAAGEQAGKMKQSGQLWILWPNDSAPE